MELWIALILAFALLLAVGVERLLARLGVRRVEPGARPFAELAERIEAWAARREAGRK